MSYDTIHTGTRHGQVKCLGRAGRDLLPGATGLTVTGPDGAVVGSDAAVEMLEGGFVILRGGTLTGWDAQAPADLLQVSIYGRPDFGGYPSDTRDLAREMMVADLRECTLCTQLRQDAGNA